MRTATLYRTLAITLVTLLCSCAPTSEQPQVTHDGLELRPGSDFQRVYVRPGASLAGYDGFGLQPCKIAFRSNWLRDQNRDRRSPGHRVTEQDVDRIKDTLAADCDRYFREALTEAPPYPLTEAFDDGEAVLVLQPAIINLDIRAPDILGPGINRSYTTSAGEATLQLEIVDATTGETLVRVVDRHRARDTGYLEWSNSVTNRAEAQRVLRHWARLLRSGLDRATATPP